jgi:hypothetical protein
VPIGLRAAALRTALERVLDEPVHALSTATGVRIHVPAPAPSDDRWRPVLEVLREADAWGSSDTANGPEIWAHVEGDPS